MIKYIYTVASNDKVHGTFASAKKAVAFAVKNKKLDASKFETQMLDLRAGRAKEVKVKDLNVTRHNFQ